MHACATSPAMPSQFAADAVAPAVLQLLLPLKHLADVVHGARYARRLQEWGIAVKVSLLHVQPANRREELYQDAPPGAAADAASTQLMQEAGLYLQRSHLDFASFLFSGELAFTILDTAEMLGCHEIVLPDSGRSLWQRRLRGDLASRLARASRSATIVLAAQDGVSSPVTP